MRRKEKNRERDKYLTSDDIPWWVGGPKKIRRSRKTEAKSQKSSGRQKAF